METRSVRNINFLNFAAKYKRLKELTPWNGIHACMQVISLLLGTGVGAGFAVTFEFKRNLNDFVQGVEDLSGQDLSEFKSKTEKFLDRAIIATGLLFLGFICMAILSVLSSLSRSSAKSSKGFFG